MYEEFCCYIHSKDATTLRRKKNLLTMHTWTEVPSTRLTWVRPTDPIDIGATSHIPPVVVDRSNPHRR